MVKMTIKQLETFLRPKCILNIPVLLYIIDSYYPPRTPLICASPYC